MAVKAHKKSKTKHSVSNKPGHKATHSAAKKPSTAGLKGGSKTWQTKMSNKITDKAPVITGWAAPKLGAKGKQPSKLERYQLAIAPKSSAKAAATAQGEEIEKLRDALGMPRNTFARLVGHTERSVANWETNASTPQGLAAQRLKELERLKESLAEVIDAKAIGPWLDTPNPAFGGLKPLELIERGEMDRLWKMVFELHSGAFA